ncbi:MAG: NIPSNAP family protein [Acidimicrobiia bacterium]
MLIEIRRYTLVPGRRDEFVGWFESEVVPAMARTGMRILGSFESLDDPDVFVYLRGFVDEAERSRLTEAFYESDAWRGGMRARAMELEVDYEVELVTSTPGSAI